MKDYYAARAKEYDKIYSKPERQIDLRSIEQWLPDSFKGKHVLEVAAGTGYWTQFIAPVAASLVALDASAETFEIARHRVPQSHVQWLIGDAYQIPMPDPLFDSAFAGFWFSHVPKSRQREFLIGLNRVLQKGSKVILLDNLYVEGNSTPVSETDEEGNTYQHRSLADGSVHRVLKNFPTEAQLRTSIDGLGTQAKYMAWQYFWAFEYVVT